MSYDSVVLPFWLDHPGSEAVEVARVADRLGVAGLWVGEMLHHDAFALAGALAVETNLSLTVGPLAVQVRDPVSLFRGVASVTALGGRPAHLALGASSRVIVEGWHGRVWSGASVRMATTVTMLRQLMEGGRVGGFRSPLGPMSGTITVAAFGPAMTAVAGSHADRLLLNLVTPGQVGERRLAVEEAAFAAGRKAPRIAVWVAAAVDPGRAAFDQLRGQIGLYLAAPGYADMLTAAGFGSLVAQASSGARVSAESIPLELVESVAAFGGEGAVRSRLDAYRQAGADEIALVPVTAGDSAGRRTLTVLRG